MASSHSGYTTDEVWAAEGLLMLSLGLPRPSSSYAKPTDGTVPAVTLRIKKIQDSSKPPLPYVCDVCSSSFNSHQALGGHMTCHRLKSTVSGATCNHDHECSTCHARFLTGQALGGHKRKHFGGSMIASSSKIKIRTISSSGINIEGGPPREERVKLDIDLNLPYHLENSELLET